jgi:Asp-tRNA(Asn)/Glu-tRNA(Gln) amidotransferase A subunit family amidase
MSDELIRKPAWQMAELVREKAVSPTELVQAHFRHIEKLNPALNAFVDLRREAALTEAQALESRISEGEELGSLAGVPVSIKSCIDVTGMKVEAGSKLRARTVAKQDAVLVQRLKDAGAIVLGVTNTPEFLMAYETDNLLYGRTSNPWNLEYSAGGSSGGESAAIAACMSAAGVGSDGGGSVRVPAHFTGICGMKPTPGVIPASGHFPVGAGPFALTGQVGPMARTVRDLRIMLDVMSGADIGDPMAGPYHLSEPTNLTDMKIGFFEEDGLHPVTPETKLAVQSAAKALADQGFIVEPFRPDGLERARELWYIIFCRFTGILFDSLVREHEDELHFLMRDLRRLQSREKLLSAADVLLTQFERDTLREKIARQMESHPVLIMPVSSGPAFRHGQMGWTHDQRPETFVDTMVYSQWFNLLGFPAAVVPVGKSPEGLPIGVQIVGRPFEEYSVCTIAEAIERVFSWQAPPIVTSGGSAASRQ